MSEQKRNSTDRLFPGGPFGNLARQHDLWARAARRGAGSNRWALFAIGAEVHPITRPTPEGIAVAGYRPCPCTTPASVGARRGGCRPRR